MNLELEITRDALLFKSGWMLGIMAWQFAVRAVMCFVNNRLKEFMESAIPADREWLNGLLNHRAYRLLGFLLNAFASVKIPQMGRKPTGDTQTITKPIP